MSEILEYNVGGYAHARFAVIEGNRSSFLVRDVRNFTNRKIIEILSLRSCVKGYGRELLKELCSAYPEYPIVVKAEPMYYSEEEYDGSKENGEYDIAVKKLSQYYLSCGFVDINDYIGYTSGRAFVYGNEIGKLIVEKMRDAYES